MVSCAQRELIRRSAGIGVLCQQLEARIIAGERVDPFEYLNLAATSSRLLRAIGLGRVPRPVNTLEQLMGGN